MSKSHSIGGLLGALLLCCAPAVAQVILSVGGASLAQDGAEDAYVAMEKSVVSLSARANVGDTVGVLAVALDKYGQPDYSTVVLLLVDSNSSTGAVSGLFQIPTGLAGMSFQLIGAALTVDGDLSIHAVTLTIALHQDANSV
jgi:hypothetical protein